jgi:hypothetical protein
MAGLMVGWLDVWMGGCLVGSIVTLLNAEDKCLPGWMSGWLVESLDEYLGG